MDLLVLVLMMMELVLHHHLQVLVEELSKLSVQRIPENFKTNQRSVTNKAVEGFREIRQAFEEMDKPFH